MAHYTRFIGSALAATMVVLLSGCRDRDDEVRYREHRYVGREEPRHTRVDVQVGVGEPVPPPEEPVVVAPPPEPVVVEPPPVVYEAPPPVVVYEAPPPMRVEVRPPPPPGPVIWVGGYWRHDTHRYLWVGGRYERVRPGYVHVEARWSHTRRGWEFHGERWDHERRVPREGHRR